MFSDDQNVSIQRVNNELLALTETVKSYVNWRNKFTKIFSISPESNSNAFRWR